LFSDYRLTFTGINGNTGTAPPLTKTQHLYLQDGKVELSNGWWKVKVEIYDDETPTPNTIATGEQDFQVNSNSQDVTIELVFSVAAGSGTLKYKIFPPGITLTDADMTLTRLGEPPSPYTIPLDIANLADDNYYPVPAGYYLAIVTLNAGALEAVKAEIVHIYPGQMTLLKFEFYDYNFHSTATDPGTPFTVTFNRNVPAGELGVTEAVPNTKTVTNGRVGTLPATNPTRSAGGWILGMVFDAWYTDPTDKGTDDANKVDENTPVTDNMTVYAHWRFEPGMQEIVGETMVHTAPRMYTNDDEGPTQGTYDGTENPDGSVTLTSGAVRYLFPDGYSDYDFVTLEYIHTGNLAVILKRGATSTDYSPGDDPDADSGQYPTLSTTGSFTFRIYEPAYNEYSNIGITFQHNSGEGTVKWTKATFTKAPDTDQNIDIDFADTGGTEVKASGEAAITYDNGAFTITYADSSTSNSNYEWVISRFMVDLGTQKLSDYSQVTFKATALNTDGQYKNIFIFASETEGDVTGYKGKPALAPISIDALDLAGVDGNSFWSDFSGRARTEGSTTECSLTINIDNPNVADLSGEIWFGIFTSADNGTEIKYSDFTFVAK
jgi:uncharacterized repeat protein (TIGR02543 family)